MPQTTETTVTKEFEYNEQGQTTKVVVTTTTVFTNDDDE